MRIFSNDVYDTKALWKHIAFLAVFTMMSYLSKGYVFILLPMFVLSAVARGRLAAMLFYVMLFCFTGISNPHIFPRTPLTFIIARLSLFALAGILMMRVAGRRNANIVTPFNGIFLYILWSLFTSIQGFDPVVSYLKILLFIPIYLALYGVANEITVSTCVNPQRIRSSLLAIVSMMVLGSAMLLPFPAISQLQMLRTEDVSMAMKMLEEGHSLFIGITNHSQALGPMLGVLLTLVFGDLVFSVKRWDVYYVLLLVVGFALIVKTSSRTGMGTLIAGFAMVIWLFLRARAINPRWRSSVASFAVLVGIMIFGSIFIIPSFQDRAMSFALKANSSTVVSSSDMTYDNITNSRQRLVEESLRNFHKKPLLGNGFQVSEDMKYIKRENFLEYMSAPIEKGVWPTAILEEGGVPGLILFGGFLLCAINLLIKRHAYIGAATLWAFIVVNLGEFSFFSMSYTGGFEWALVFVAVILDGQRMKEAMIRQDINTPWADAGWSVR